MAQELKDGPEGSDRQSLASGLGGFYGRYQSCYEATAAKEAANNFYDKADNNNDKDKEKAASDKAKDKDKAASEKDRAASASIPWRNERAASVHSSDDDSMGDAPG